MTRRRLDAELVRRGLARSRQQASELIAAGHVNVNHMLATKASTQVEDTASVIVRSVGKEYVSRGAHKLVDPLERFGLDVSGRHALDAGLRPGFHAGPAGSRSGPRRGSRRGIWPTRLALQQDSRVTVLDRTNVRHLRAEDLPYAPDLVVADLSFISLTKVLGPLASVADAAADFCPAREAAVRGREGSRRQGWVVRDPDLHAWSVRTVAAAAADLGLGVAGLCRSPLPGPSGNIEFVLWLRQGAPELLKMICRRHWMNVERVLLVVHRPGRWP